MNRTAFWVSSRGFTAFVWTMTYNGRRSRPILFARDLWGSPSTRRSLTSNGWAPIRDAKISGCLNSLLELCDCRGRDGHTVLSFGAPAAAAAVRRNRGSTCSSQRVAAGASADARVEHTTMFGWCASGRYVDVTSPAQSPLLLATASQMIALWGPSGSSMVISRVRVNHLPHLTAFDELVAMRGRAFHSARRSGRRDQPTADLLNDGNRAAALDLDFGRCRRPAHLPRAGSLLTKWPPARSSMRSASPFRTRARPYSPPPTRRRTLCTRTRRPWACACD